MVVVLIENALKTLPKMGWGAWITVIISKIPVAIIAPPNPVSAEST